MSAISNLQWFLAKKRVKILIVPSFWLKFDDVIVMLSLNCIVMSYFFTNSPSHDLTPNQKLLRLNVIFMVRKIGKKVHANSPAPFICLILERRQKVRSENFFMDRCPMKNWKNWKNLLRVASTQLAIGGLRYFSITFKTKLQCNIRFFTQTLKKKLNFFRECNIGVFQGEITWTT